MKQLRFLLPQVQGGHEGSSILKLGGKECHLSDTTYFEDGGLVGPGARYQWTFNEETGVLSARAKGSEAWTVVQDTHFVRWLARYCATITPAERTRALNAASPIRKLKIPTLVKLRQLAAGVFEQGPQLSYFAEHLKLKDVGITDRARGG